MQKDGPISRRVDFPVILIGETILAFIFKHIQDKHSETLHQHVQPVELSRWTCKFGSIGGNEGFVGLISCTTFCFSAI